MTSTSVPDSSVRRVPQPPPGSLVGGRFEVLDVVRDEGYGSLVRARDNKTRTTVALRVLYPDWTGSEEVHDALRHHVKLASQIRHRGIANEYGMGRTDEGGLYTVSEWIGGQPLSTVITQRRNGGPKFSLLATYNIISHLAKALAAAHAAPAPSVIAHGALRPDVVWLGDHGRVCVTELGLSSTLGPTGAWQRLGVEAVACLAPELKAGKTPDARTDVFGLGAVLYVLLTQRFPHEEFLPPSHMHSEVGGALDAIVLRCLSQDPAARYDGPLSLLRDIMPLVGLSPEAPAQVLGLDVEIDVDVAASLPPPPMQPPAAATRPLESPPPADASAQVDFGDLFAKITENDAPRWMLVKEGLDHGPFSGRELVQLILNGNALDQHGLVNLDTGERKQLHEQPELVEFLQQYKLRKAEADHQAALVRTEKIDKRSTAAKLLILAASLGGLGLIAAGYLLTRPAAREVDEAEANLADLYDSGQVKIQGNVGLLGPADSKRIVRKGGAGAASGPGGAGLSYADAMNQAMELGDAAQGGGERQLTSNVIAGVMNGSINSLFGCVSQELRSGGRLGHVKIDLAIAGSGKVLGTTVHTGSPAFQRCIATKVSQVSFPAFPAPRMGARYSFQTD